MHLLLFSTEERNGLISLVFPRTTAETNESFQLVIWLFTLAILHQDMTSSICVCIIDLFFT